MAIAIPNYEFSYRRKGRPIFVPTPIGRRIGLELKEAVETAFTFDPIFFHFSRGGHVAALHQHRPHSQFAKIDISRFFYGISRRRVQSALSRVQVPRPRFYAKWSTVANPFNDPRFALPYGFIQSPILASLTLATSTVGRLLTNLSPAVSVGVYMDDISFSSDDGQALQNAFETTILALQEDGFEISLGKLRPPSSSMDIFNCDLSHGKSIVRDERIEQFLSTQPNPVAEEAFVAYCATVKAGNSR